MEHGQPVRLWGYLGTFRYVEAIASGVFSRIRDFAGREITVYTSDIKPVRVECVEGPESVSVWS